MSSDREMDTEYARLSILAGMFAAAADHVLGTHLFGELVRRHAWDLSEAKLEEWKQQAIEMGAPAEMLEPTEVQRMMMPLLIAEGIRLQAQVDNAC